MGNRCTRRTLLGSWVRGSFAVLMWLEGVVASSFDTHWGCLECRLTYLTWIPLSTSSLCDLFGDGHSDSHVHPYSCTSRALSHRSIESRAFRDSYVVQLFKRGWFLSHRRFLSLVLSLSILRCPVRHLRSKFLLDRKKRSPQGG
ncbi:hypothetical protein GALMADRAFT_716676 [Galerina marginata CBS 339.88]|uniref:Secreted protein n=1 Tax=Galerina marginata (strain CBS 339.88) TaxID=685588 RepID=A0A067TMU2_GALM3|nr:hypothetical protein GALMADRAFT_716676 [Galerina marginata CBS 339.88]